MRGIAKHCNGTSGCRCMSCVINRRRARQSEQNKKRWAKRSKEMQRTYKPKPVKTTKYPKYQINKYNRLVRKWERTPGEPSMKAYYAKMLDAEVIEEAQSIKNKTNYEVSLIRKEYKIREITPRQEKSALKEMNAFYRKYNKPPKNKNTSFRRIMKAIFS